MALLTRNAAAPGIAPAADVIRHATFASALGKVLVARSATGVCAILFGDTKQETEAELASRFPKSTLVADATAVRDAMAKVARFIENPAEGLDLTLDMRGTRFQRRVWEMLRRVPAGKTATYLDLARRIDPSASPRAVGSACAANPIALAIPCHRVVRSDGNLAGYRWGLERKRQLIDKEAKA